MTSDQPPIPIGPYTITILMSSGFPKVLAQYKFSVFYHNSTDMLTILCVRQTISGAPTTGFTTGTTEASTSATDAITTSSIVLRAA